MRHRRNRSALSRGTGDYAWTTYHCFQAEAVQVVSFRVWIWGNGTATLDATAAKRFCLPHSLLLARSQGRSVFPGNKLLTNTVFPTDITRLQERCTLDTTSSQHFTITRATTAGKTTGSEEGRCRRERRPGCGRRYRSRGCKCFTGRSRRAPNRSLLGRC